ncbi:protein of unknown function [Bradyrhizobium vignae]|uniref:Uncharacterized protein n=1 Tax=Bradyrhizobium vignae TaxID=1549949 RepID=A0A2U3PWH2_9BRAD|nr:protein of unknown function [Bradyrhizobium vignae]
MFCNNSLHPCYKRSFHNQPSVAFAAESERLGGTCASLLEYVRINRCSRYLNAYAVFPAPLCPRNLPECGNGRLDQNRPLPELSPLRPKATEPAKEQGTAPVSS